MTRWTLGESTASDSEVAASRSHVAVCPACRAALARFGRAIRSPSLDEIPCAEARAGAAALHPRPEVANHLEHCADCRAEHTAWQHVLALEQQGALAEPPSYPVFNLSFLPRIEPVWAHLGAAIRRLTYEIPAAPALAGQLVSPPPRLAVQYATVQARRRGAPGAADKMVSLAVDDEEQDVRITLSVTAAAEARWLAVAMHLLSTGRPLSGERVALCNEQGQAQEIKTVRANESEARFPDLAPGVYLVRVERSGKIWELPVRL